MSQLACRDDLAPPGHRPQRPGLAPISPVVIDYFADRPRPDRLDDRAGRNPPGRPIDRSAGLIAPSRVVISEPDRRRLRAPDQVGLGSA